MAAPHMFDPLPDTGAYLRRGSVCREIVNAKPIMDAEDGQVPRQYRLVMSQRLDERQSEAFGVRGDDDTLACLVDAFQFQIVDIIEPQ